MDNNITLLKIGILIPSKSKKEWKNIYDTLLYNNTIRTLLNTTHDTNYIVFYIGIDEDDKIWTNQENHKILLELKNYRKNIDFKFFYMKNIAKGHLTRMWNKLFQHAYQDNCDYFYQCGDDIEFTTVNWLEDSIKILKSKDNLGVTGPIDHNDWRFKNRNISLTQTFISRKHMEIFKYYFPSTIINWQCDYWINDIYKPNLFYPLLQHKCLNMGGFPRYTPGNQEQLRDSLVKEGRTKIQSYLNDIKRNNLNI